MKKFTFLTFILAGILCLTSFTGTAQNIVDISASDDPYVLQDTLAGVADGSIILLKPGMTYEDTVGFDFDKSIDFRSKDPEAAEMPRINRTTAFNTADGANIDSIVFRNILFDNGLEGYNGEYVFNITENSTIGTIMFESCRIRGLRGITRLKEGTGTLGNYVLMDCVVDSIREYAILRVDKDTWSAGDIILKNSTFNRTQYFLRSDSNTGSVTIENCTLYEVPDVGRQIFRWETDDDSKNNVTNGITIKNTIWGPGWDMENEGKTGVKGYQGLSNTTFTIVNTFATSDFEFSSDTIDGFPNVTYSGTAKDLWVDPDNMDFNFKDLSFEGSYNAGDPRWYAENPNKEWNISNNNFNALGEISATTVVDGLTIYASTEGTVKVDANNKSLDGMDFTHRMKLGGSGKFDENGNPTRRVLSFDVTGSSKITVIGMSSNNDEDRQLVIAVDSMNNELARFPALGGTISKGEYTYAGGPATILLFSPSSGVNIYYIKVEPVVPDEQEWNISLNDFNGLGEMTETVTVAGLTIHASGEKEVKVDANNKSLDGIDYTHRLKLGGSGAFDDNGKAVARVLSFKVTGSSVIKVIGMSSNNDEDRQLHLASNHKDSIFGTFPAIGGTISKGEFFYSGGPATIYLYSPSSGVNLYHIMKAKVPVTAKIQRAPEFRIYPNPATDRVHIDVKEPVDVAIFNMSGVKVLQKRIESSMDYINVNGLPGGMYLVKPMIKGSAVQKLIVH